MDEIITCSMNCQNKPAYVCDCSDEKIFLCLDHAGPHGESNGNHHYSRITKTPDPQTKIIINKFLNNLKLQAKQDRLIIIQKSSSLIKQISEETSKSLDKLLSIEKKLDEYIYLCSTLNEINNLNRNGFIESLLKLSAEDAAKINLQNYITKVNSDNFKEKIKNMFAVQETKNWFNINIFKERNKPIIKYFRNKTLYAVDLMTLRKKSQNINKNWQEWDPTCLLDDGSVFCCFQSNTFIISPNNSIINLDSSQYSSRSGLIAVKDFVYMFGGSGNASLKFSLKSKNWIALFEYPILKGDIVSCAALNGIILIGDYLYPYIYGYNISKNWYTLIPLSLNSSTGKTFLATENKAYAIEFRKSYYESGFNDINSWTLIGPANIFSTEHARHSYPLLYEDSFYFIVTGCRLIQFNLKNKELKDLKAL